MTIHQPHQASEQPPSTHREPRFADLPELGKSGERHAWNHFGPHDQLGTLNWITETTVAEAATEIRLGHRIPLSLPLTLPNPPLVPSREGLEHRIRRHRHGSDDSIDGFFLQCSSQWDGLAHVRYRQYGYYGGRQESELNRGELGIDHMATAGIIGRGVLVDVERFCRLQGVALDPSARSPIDAELIDKALEAQGTEIRRGDVLLLRTGWMSWYLQLSQADREFAAGTLRPGPDALACPGLDPSQRTAQWLWDHGISATAADNPGLECLPVDRTQGFLHHRLIALLGMPIGELFSLDTLAAQCEAQGRWSFFLASSPLPLPAGVGSPSNAHAVL